MLKYIIKVWIVNLGNTNLLVYKSVIKANKELSLEEEDTHNLVQYHSYEFKKFVNEIIIKDKEFMTIKNSLVWEKYVWIAFSLTKESKEIVKENNGVKEVGCSVDDIIGEEGEL